MTSWARAFVVVAALAGLVSSSSRAAETDQYYAWFVTMPEAGPAIDARINDGFDEVLLEVNRQDPPSWTCSDVALRMLDRHFRTALWFIVGATHGRSYPTRPASTTEFHERYEPVSLYRYQPLYPVGSLIPVDPSVRVGDMVFGTDKLAHFLTNSPRYWRAYREARDAGATVEDAEKKAVAFGVAQENGWLGLYPASSFSYADLEANWQGLRLIRSWCEGIDGRPPALTLDDTRQGKRWVLHERLELSRWLNPCWDESFYPNVFVGLTAEGVRRALHEYCRFRARPEVARQRQRYRELGCHSFSVKYLDELIAKGQAPDPRPFTLENACGDPPAR